METNTNSFSMLRDFDELEKTETTLEELRNSDDWEQALIVITDDSFPYSQFIESRTYLTTRGSAYFNKDIEDNSLPGINLSFSDYNPIIDQYIAGNREIVFNVEKCYKLWSTYDINRVLKCIDDLTSITIDESDEELEDAGDYNEVLMEDEVDEIE